MVGPEELEGTINKVLKTGGLEVQFKPSYTGTFSSTQNTVPYLCSNFLGMYEVQIYFHDTPLFTKPQKVVVHSQKEAQLQREKKELDKLIGKCTVYEVSIFD